MKRLIPLAGLMLALGGCGAREGLAPPPGQALPIAPYGATATPTPQDLLKPPMQTRPARSDDLIESVDRRRSDQFDLPPPN
ncbi:hypothetical protein [Sphingomonas sp. M1-B02]|uniref:hypothetical protein n=1 Tax=Sphingomonas sp. M1-B02 TaxID=3114300 RepID=UPI0022409A98|nr:hypothetical protein [Sphingomonas sp. S6-11]UZK65031.1 hypothetical protein OKW87_10945 [Sphingomonas sp. S6-11]